jgi:HEAT repeat protein
MRHLLAALCLLSLALPALARQEPTPSAGPSAEEVATTCKLLEAALAPKADPDGAREALKAARGVLHKDVIALIDSRGLRHDDLAIRDAAVEALARMDHPAALEALHAALKRDKKELADAPPRFAALLKAIARHGKESSIKLLVEDLFQSPDRGVVTARILGLGNIRAKASVDELIQMMRSAPRPRVTDFMAELRTALVVLTGEDKGTDQELWINWYGDHKSSLTIAPEPPEALAPEVRRRWMTYWGPELKREKTKRGPGK